MLLKLKLSNFKQHRDLSVDFTAGLNVITGDNGAGKSTILKAILFALYGATAAGTKSHLLTWDSQESLEVNLTLAIGSDLISISRGLTKSEVYKNDELSASGQTSCTKLIESLLGLDYKQFKHLLYAAQGETQALLRMGSADLQRKIEEMTKLDELDAIISKIGEDVCAATAKLSVIPQTNTSALQDEITDLAEQETKLNSKVEEVQMQLAAKIKESEGILAKLDKEILPQINLAKELKKRREHLVKSIELCQAEIRGLMKPNFSAAELRSAFTGGTQLINNLNYAIKLQSKVDQEIQGIERWESWERFAGQRGDYVVAQEQAKATLGSLLSELKALQEIKLDCPTCNRPFDSESNSHAKGRIPLLEKKIIIYNKTIRDLSKEIDEIDRHTQGELKNVNYEAEKARLNSSLVKVQAELDSLDFGHRNLFDSLNMIKSVTPDEKEILAAEKYEKQVYALESMLERLEDELDSLEEFHTEWGDADVDAMQVQYTEVRAEEKAYYEELQTFKTQRAKAQYDLEHSKKDLERQKEQEAQRKEWELDAAARKELQSFLRNNRARFMSDTWGSITDLTSAYTREITQGLISELSRGDDGQFTVTEGDNKSVPVSELSGAREAIVGLSLRIALAKTFFGDASFILLDEVTAACSENNAASVAGTLMGLGTQVVMVSHRQGDSSNAANIIYLG